MLRRMRLRGLWRAFVGLAAAGVLVPANAAAEVHMKWDCYLPSSGIDCALLQSSLTSKIPFLATVDDPHEADVLVSVTSIPAENGTRFRFDFIGRRVDGYTTEVHSTDKIPSSVDSITAMVRLLTKLERGLDDFMDQRTAAEVKDGALTLTLVDPVQLPFTGRPEQQSVKWYVSPGVGTYFSDVQGVGINAQGNVTVNLNYSERAWRLQQWIGANYARQSQPVPGTTETASITFAGGSAGNVLTRALGDDSRWSASLLMAAEKNPQANYTMRANASAGIEFDLVPRQTVNQQNLGFRCAVGPEFQRYDATNIEGLDQQLVGRQFCDAFVGWHFAPADLAVSLGETSILKSVDYRGFSAYLSVTWRVTDNFILTPWVYLQGIHKATNEVQPTNAVYKDPRQEIEASMLAAVEGSYTAPFGVQTGLSLRFLFGNGSLASEDQRWKGVSNLR
jgi:hypothetical protein